MGELLFGETNSSREARESEKGGREVDVYFYRHAEAEGEGVEAGLTEVGRQQARQAAEDLLGEITGAGGVIKFLSSPVRRAQETAGIMRGFIAEAIERSNIQNIRLMSSRERDAVKAAGVIGPLRNKGIEDPIEHWLRNPGAVEGKSPEVISRKVQDLLKIIKKVTDRLPPGEKVNYVTVTHEVPQAALLNSATGKTLNEQGGGIKNCESFKVHMEGKSEKKPTLNFRGVETQMEI